MRSLASRVALLALLAASACRTPDPAPAATIEKRGTFGSHEFSVRRDGESAVVVFVPPLPPADVGFIAGAAAATYAAFGVVLRENVVDGSGADYTVSATNGQQFKLVPVKAGAGEIAGARVERLP